MRPRPPSFRPDLVPLETRTAPAAAGRLDPTFGDGGRTLLTAGPPGGFLPTVALSLPDGATLVAGEGFVVSRLTPGGSLDTSFGVAGLVNVSLGPTDPETGADVFNEFPTALAAQPDGRVLVAGWVRNTSGTVLTADFAVARLTADGRLDPTFGEGGRVVVGFDTAADPAGARDDRAGGIAVLPDGRIALAGFTHVLEPGGTFPRTVSGAMAAARLTADGKLDPTFGDGGRARVEFPVGGFNTASANAVAVQPDGRIVLAGSALVETGRTSVTRLGTFTEQFFDFAAIRLTADGKLDPTFGDGGRARPRFDQGTKVSEEATAAAVRPDGTVFLAGTSRVPNATGDGAEVGSALARLTADGRLDPAFDGDGLALGAGFPSRIVFAPDGRVVLVGTEVVRLTADGQPDQTFGTGGRRPTPFYRPTDGFPFNPRAVAVEADGDIVLAGRRQTETFAVRLTGTDRPAGPAVPGTILAGGSADGIARPLMPVAGWYEPGDPIQFFPGFAGEVRTATADVTGDGVPDYVGGAGPGGGPRVVVIDGATGAVVADFFAFEETFAGGVFVAAGDLDGDGKAEVVVTPDRGGGPVVAVYSGARLAAGAGGAAAQVARFFGIEDPAFRGGARAAVGDVNADGVPDLVVSAGFLGGPRVAVFNGKDVAAGSGTPGRLMADFFAFEESVRNGAFVAAGDVDGDGFADLALGGGPGGGPRVRVVDGKRLLGAGGFATLDEVADRVQVANFFAGSEAARGGVRLAFSDAGGDGRADLVAGSGEGEPGRVRAYTGVGLPPLQELDLSAAVLPGGVYVG